MLRKKFADKVMMKQKLVETTKRFLEAFGN